MLVFWPSIAGLLGVVALPAFGLVLLVFGSGLRPANLLICFGRKNSWSVQIKILQADSKNNMEKHAF